MVTQRSLKKGLFCISVLGIKQTLAFSSWDSRCPIFWTNLSCWTWQVNSYLLQAFFVSELVCFSPDDTQNGRSSDFMVLGVESVSLWNSASWSIFLVWLRHWVIAVISLCSYTRFHIAERFQLEPVVKFVWGKFSPSCKISPQNKFAEQGLSQWFRYALNPVMIFLPQGVLLSPWVNYYLNI